MQNSNSNQELIDNIAGFLLSQWPNRSNEKQNLLESKNLFDDNWLDSVTQVRLVLFLDQLTNKKIPALKFSRNTFQTIHSIAAIYTKNE
ncbi:MAG: hypothetical protein M9962_14975 [Oligoflexia bacterium]|nr:hypothetical protein [Oligoflexia bacterium]